MTQPPVPDRCECTDPYHGIEGCPQKPADHENVVTSPALCMACLFGCEL